MPAQFFPMACSINLLLQYTVDASCVSSGALFGASNCGAVAKNKERSRSKRLLLVMDSGVFLSGSNMLQ